MVCDESHRFDVRRIGTDPKGTFRTTTLQEIKSFVTTGVSGNRRTGVSRTVRLAEPGEKPWLDNRGYSRYQVPIAEPIDYPEQNLPIHPYLLGVLLGDGGLTDINSVNITTMDEDIIEFISTILPEGHTVVSRSYKSKKYFYQIQSKLGKSSPVIDGRSGGFRKQLCADLEQLGLRGKSALEKHIPELYLLGSIEQREWLLRGLMDTDGTRMNSNDKKATVKGVGGLSFGSSSKQLINGVIQLVRSLGGISMEGKPYYPYYYKNNEKIISKNLAYRIGIRLPATVEPFYCARKKATYTGPVSQKSNSGLVRSIKNIESAGSARVKCISVDNAQERFVITDYVVSKNSAKSTVLNMFTAWCIGRHTAAKMPLQIIYISYNIATAIPKSRIIKQIVDSVEFKKIFPNCRLKPGMQSDVGWSIDFEYAGIPRVGDEEFTLRAAGLRGSITSKRAHLCLTGDTLILTDQGEQPIKKIYADPGRFQIAVRNSKTHQIDWSDVAAATRRCSSKIVRIRTTDNRYISATPEHPFLTTDQGYEWAGDISPGQTLIGVSACESIKGLLKLRSGKTTHTKNLYNLLAKTRKISSRDSMPLLSGNIHGYVFPFSPEIKHRSKNSVLFSDLCGAGEANFKTSGVSVLQQKVSPNIAYDTVLFSPVCRFKSFQKNDRCRQPKLPAWGLYRRLQKTEENSFKSGQFHLCRLQYEGEEVIYKRRDSANKPVCSSHRSRPVKQHSLQSYNALPSMPCGSPSDYRQNWETLTVSGVEKISGGTHIVYDLEIDHPDHNFIANGFVVSNCFIDDPIKSSADIRNPAIRDEMNNNWSSVIAPIIFEGGRAICLGTRFHPLDIHKTMFTPEKNWKQVTQEAVTYDNQGNPVSYWPEQWSVQYLLGQKELDPVAFAFQYQQQPVLTTDLIVSPDLLVRAEVETEFDSLAIGIDLSASRSETSDYTAFVLGGRLKDKYFIIDSHQCRSIGNLEKIDLLCDMLLEWGILSFQNDTYFPTYSTVTLVVESVAYQASLAADLKRVLLNERGLSNLHIHEVNGFRGDKIARFRGTLGLLENKKIVFNRYRKFDALFDQIINVGATSHDDLLDAYTHLITYLQRRGNYSIEY